MTAYVEHGPNGAVIKGELSLKGVMLHIHPKVSVDFLFDGEGRIRDLMEAALGDEAASLDGWTQVKTQFGTPDVHITINKLMRYLSGKFFSDFEVSDEGDFWETSDAVLLSKRFRFLDNAIDAVADALSKESSEGMDDDPLSLADKIEETIKNLRLPGEDG